MMKKLLILIAAVAVIFLGYKLFFAGGPKKAFTEFCDLWGTNQLDKAWTFSVKDEAAANFKGKSVNEVTHFMMEAIMGAHTTVSSSSSGPGLKEKSYDGTTLIFFTPPGMTSAFPTHFAKIRVEGTVRKTPAGWKVVAFTPTFLELGELRKN
jgi:hypothetical protein